VILAALAALLALVLCAPALAESPNDFSASDQYVETLPTSKGPSATKDRKAARRALPSEVASRLEKLGGADAAALEAVATATEFGAPQGKAGSADNSKRKGRGSSGSTPAVPSASVEAVRDDGGDLLWLLLALLAISGLMVGAVAYQRHRNSNSD
jgi:hypothetical protein